MSLLLLAAIAAWLTIGVAAVGAMHHRGHDVFSWSLLFVLLGPLAIPLAVSADRHQPPQPAWPNHLGAVDLLVDYTRAGAATGLRAALALLGDRVTSVTLAEVVDAEAATTVRGRATCDEAQARLDAAAGALAAEVGAPVDTVVLFGEPAKVLPAFAAEHGYELLVGGRRLAGQRAVPVLVGGPSDD